MSRLLLVVICAIILVAGPVLSSSSYLVDDLDEFGALLEIQERDEIETNQHLTESEDVALLETSTEEADGENPSYTLPYPAVTYASHAAGGFVHPFSNVNPLAAPWAGFAPVAAPHTVATAAAIAAAPLSAYYGGLHHPAVAQHLGINTALYPAALQPIADAKGGYNVHGLNPGNVYGTYHPGLAADLTSLSGEAPGGGEAEASFIESGQSSPPLAGELHDSANIEADAEKVAYGLFPAPAPHQNTHFVRSNGEFRLGPHKLQFEPVGSNEIDAAFPAFIEMAAQNELEAEADIDADLEALTEGESESDSEVEMTDADFADLESESAMEEGALLQVTEDDDQEAGGGGGGAAEGGPNPSYTLPYPPVLPGHYTPLFNPYTNVNPLATPFSNYAAQPGAHPGVAAAAAAQAGALAAVNGQIAGGAGGYPYYPFAARNPIVAAQLQGNPVPFSGYAGWIHPQNLNSASVGTNEDAASLGQFIEVATEETEHTGCVGCEY